MKFFFRNSKVHENVLRSNRGKFKVNAPVLYFIFHISVCMHYTDKVEVRLSLLQEAVLTVMGK